MTDSIEVDFQEWQNGLLTSTAATLTPSLPLSSPAPPAPLPSSPTPSVPLPTSASVSASPSLPSSTSLPSAVHSPFSLRRPTACAASYDAHATAALLGTRLEGGGGTTFYRSGTVAMPVRYQRPLNVSYGDSMLELGLCVPPPLTYATGDHIGIYPENDPALVDRIADRCGVDPSLEVVGSVPGPRQRVLPFPAEGLRVRDILARCLELQSLPQPAALAVLASCAADPAERAQLAAWASTGALYKDAVWRPNLHLVDVLDTFQSVQLSLGNLIQAVPPLRPRYYSIASSALQYPADIRVVYRWVHYRHGASGRERQGVCTRYLKGLREPQAPRPGTGPGSGAPGSSGESSLATSVHAFVRPSTFRQPADPATPVVFVAGGSGIAPVRAFLEERLHLALTQGVHYGPALLAFGVREPDDLACGDLIRACLRAGALTNAVLSYSTPAPASTPTPYVPRFVAQDIDEHGAEIWRTLADGGNLYLCGGASAFASSCHQALRRVFRAHGGLTDPDAQEAFFVSLLQSKRYQEDLAD